MQGSLARRLGLYAVIAGAVAAALIGFDRHRFEAQNRSVEITMDQQDLADFAHAYGYDLDELMREMRRAGLTSVAVYEEQGQRVNSGSHALALTGQQVIDSARVSALGDPLLAHLVAARAVDPASVYLLVYDEPTLRRYLAVLRTQLEPHTVSLVRLRLPAIVRVRTQIDFFNSLGLGIPQDVADQVRADGLLVDPRVQNNERMDPDGIAATFGQMTQGGRIGTIIFFGTRNEVLGYPFNLDATAASFAAYHVDFGDVEAYTKDQVQKGSTTLARKVVQQTVRVQAISKLELDKLDLDVVVDRYLLGVRERNIRVIYLRPFPHVIQVRQPDGSFATESAEQTNLEMLRRLRDRLSAAGFHPGRAAGFIDYKSFRLTLLYFIVALGAAGAFLLLLDLYGWARAWMTWAFFGITTVAFWAAAIVQRDYAVRELWALGAALTFALLAGTTLAPYFNTPRPTPGANWLRDARDGVMCLLRGVGVAALGGLFVAGLLSQASFMIEVQQFLGTKLLLALPPLVLLCLYGFAPLFGARSKAGDVASAPLRAWQFAAILIIVAGAVLLVMRSGNDSDVGVSDFEARLRPLLTALLGVRPRFKEFALGFPALMLLPALSAAHRRAAGWFIALAGTMALADVIDTFSHIHTPIAITLLRVAIGLVVGAAIGIVVQRLYRLLFRERLPRT